MPWFKVDDKLHRVTPTSCLDSRSRGVIPVPTRGYAVQSTHKSKAASAGNRGLTIATVRSPNG